MEERCSAVESTSSADHLLDLESSQEIYSVTSVYDVGKLLAEGRDLHSLSTSERFNILTNHIKAKDITKFPSVWMNACNRKFNPKWIEQYPWLVYSPHQDGGYCLPCTIFASCKFHLKTLVTEPFKKWTKVSTVLGEHEEKQYHGEAVNSSEMFKEAILNPNRHGVDVCLNKQISDIIDSNTKVLKSIIKTVMFCGRQGFPLRGHHDDTTVNPSSNRGNVPPFYPHLYIHVLVDGIDL